MKKLAALAGAGAMLLGLTAPVFGCYGMYCSWSPRKDIAIVTNTATAYSNTGANSQSNIADVYHGGGVTVNGAGGNRTIYTGEADAYAGALTVANTHVGCGSCSYEPWHKDFAKVTNRAYADANTGVNFQDDAAIVRHGGGVTVNGGWGTRYINTKSADSDTHAWTIVNTHWH